MNGDQIFEYLSQRQTEAWHSVFPDLHRNVQFLLNTHPLLKLSEDEARQVAVDTLVEVVGRFSALPINSTENLKIFARRIALRRGIDLKRAQIMVNDPSNEEHKNTLERLDQFATYLDQTGDSEMGKFLCALGDCLEPFMNENSGKELVDIDLFHRSEPKDDNVRLKQISDEVTAEMKEQGFEIPLMKSHTWLSEFAFLTSVVEPFLPPIIPMSEAESEEILKQVKDRFPLNESKVEPEDELPDADILESPKKSQRMSPVCIGFVLSAILILGYLIFSGDSVDEPYSVPGVQVEAISKGGAIVLSINGEVNASETDGDERLNVRTLKNRDLLIPGTQLETGEKCEVVLLMTNGSLVTLGEGARMKLSEFEQEEFEGTDDKIFDLTEEPSESHVLIDLDLGELVVEVKKLKKESSFDLGFSLGFAGIRGTQYRILATARSSRLSVLEGGVAVSKELGGQDDLIDSERAISLEEGLGNRLDEATTEELDRIRFVNGKARELAEDIKLNELADAFDQINERLALAKEQRELEKEMQKAVTEGSYLVESAVNLPMIWCESGSFLMGSTKGENGREPNETRHEVTLRNGFFLGKYELTQEEYMAVMGDNPSKFNGTKLPVESLNWDDAEKFCKKLTEQEQELRKIPMGWIYTLPTEAEWEYACRAGTTTTYSWGNEINSTLANYSESEMNRTVNGGNYLPNPWGFYDMHGNVSEWVREKHLGYPLSKDAEPKAGEGELSWLYRGGPWHFSSRYLRSAKRGVHPSSHSYYSVGMRLCLKKAPSPVFEKTAMSDQLDQGLETMKEKFDRLSKKEVGNGIHIVEFAANMEMIWCKPGDFVMGDENNSRNVTLTKGFFLGKYEVTQEEYQKVMGKNPSKFKGNKNRPVEKVTWFDAMEFCKKLTESEHKSDRLPKDWVFTLPTEAEWEYACRAGTTTRYSWGISIEPTLANYKASEIGGTLKVGNYKPNNWGIHDMHGNVGEWTKDWKAKYPKLNSTDPQGPESGTSRSVRGEFWFSDNLSTYGRGDVIPERRWGYVGFRICLKQLPENKQASMPVEGKPWTVPSIGLEMNWCPPGTFMMGSPENEVGRIAGEETQHKVTLTKGFFLGKYEVTQEEYQKVMGKNPSRSKGNRLPIDDLSWLAAKEFCEKLNSMNGIVPEGWTYTLPTEAQWEYACRAGTKTPYSWGDNIVSSNANYTSDVNQTIHRDYKQTLAVGQYSANPWGFFDLHGNLAEWTADWYEPLSSSNPVIDPTGPITGQRRVKRGGSWGGDGSSLRSAMRKHNREIHRSRSLGFRLCLKEISAVGKQASINNQINLNDGLVGWWKFDEKEGKFAKDSSGKNRNGELKNFDSNTTQWVVGPVGNAISLDGIDDFIDVGDFEWGGALSFSAWIYYRSYQAWARVLDFGDGPKSNDIFVSDGFMAKGNRFIVSIKGSGGTNIPNLFKRRQWYHMAFTASSDRVLALFANGEKVGSDKLTRIPPKITRKLQYFGKSQHKQDSHLKGILDDLRIYDRAINESEIKALFQLGDSRGTKIGLVEKKEMLSVEQNKSLILEPKHKDDETLEILRIFKSVQGSSFEGRVLSYEGNNFFLEGKDAKIISVTLNQLSKEDQKYLQETVQAGKIGTGNPHETGSTPVEGKPWTVPSIGLEMNWCEPGTFMMGSPESEEGRREDEIQTKVTLSNGFFLGKYEVKVKEYLILMDKVPGGGFSSSPIKGEQAIAHINWSDAIKFSEKLTKLESQEGRLPEGWVYSMPTEAEWEYACRAGTAFVYSWGSNIDSSRANYNWDRGGGDGRDFKETIEVGSYAPNPWGFYDMHGNAAEMVLDWMANLPGGEVADPVGPMTGSFRVQRGGSWLDRSNGLRSAARKNMPMGQNNQGQRNSILGFRLCLKQIPNYKPESMQQEAGL